MSDGRFSHEETATDRWVGAMLEVSRRDGPARVDALVGRAVDGVRADRAAAARRARRWGWRAPLAAAASIAVFTGAVLFLAPQPASAGALLREAQAAERRAGDRRYRIDLEFPVRPGGGAAPTASGTFDVRDAGNMRLEIRMPDGRATVRAIGGGVSWTLSPQGEVLRLPEGAPWPRYIETPEGDLLVDRIDAMLGDIGAFYSIERCDAGGEVRLCAERVDPAFRGPGRIELTLDAARTVRRAVLRFDGPQGPPPREGGPRPRPAPPTRIEVTRIDLPEGGLPASRFAPPSEPVRDAPMPPEGGRPQGPPPFDGPPPHGDRPRRGPPPFDGPPPHGDRPPPSGDGAPPRG
jgi:hypothetical protein